VRRIVAVLGLAAFGCGKAASVDATVPSRPAVVLCVDVRPSDAASVRAPVNESIARFLAAFPEHADAARLVVEWSHECPAEAKSGCIGRDGSIYCSEAALLRIGVGGAWQAEHARSNGWGTTRDSNLLAHALPIRGDERWDGTIDPSLAPAWKRGLDLAVWFVLGHEAYHAFGECPIAALSPFERTGDFDAIVAMQREEFLCPNPPDMVEAYADACALRFLDRADRRGATRDLPHAEDELGRALGLQMLWSAFRLGLGPPNDEHKPAWSQDGHLYSSLRTLAVYRLLAARAGRRDFGFCGEALGELWEMVNREQVCVDPADWEREGGNSIVVLQARHERAEPWEIFEGAPLVEGSDTWCLDIGARVPRPSSVRRDPTVRVRTFSGGWEDEEELDDPHLSRPFVHGQLSRCLPHSETSVTLDAMFDAKGRLASVRGGPDAVRSCVETVLRRLSIGHDVFVDPRPLEPGDPDPDDRLRVVRIRLNRSSRGRHEIDQRRTHGSVGAVDVRLTARSGRPSRGSGRHTSPPRSASARRIRPRTAAPWPREPARARSRRH
jgi:hypothetical protein